MIRQDAKDRAGALESGGMSVGNADEADVRPFDEPAQMLTSEGAYACEQQADRIGRCSHI
jgi:hypothetical protein